MFLKKDKRPNGRIYLSIVESYRDPETKKPKQRKVKSLGFLDDLEKEYDNTISHFSLLAKQMTEEAKNKELPLDFSFSPDETIDSSAILRKNLGFSVLSYFYHKLGINNFFINRQRNLNIDYSLNNIFQMLVYFRVLDPCSKKSSSENMDNFFLNFNFYKDDLLLHIHEMVRMTYGRDTSNVYYDVTNYYFEIKEPDDFRKKGVSKEHRPNPIIQMGLLMDNSGLPINYKLFEDNTNDCSTLMPVLNDLKNDYGLSRVIVIADKGMNTSENIAYNILHKNGYIYSQTVRGANADLKEYVLSDNCIKFKNKSGLKRIYVAKRFENLRKESEENIITKEGITERLNRSIQAEGIFSYIKSGIKYSRCRYKRMEKNVAEMKLLSFAINIKKLNNKMGFVKYKEAI